jgi:sulfatase maturation enzyme AslB (radical SAM superfamily)
MAQEPEQTIDQEKLGIADTWNHDYLKDVRQRLTAGEWLPECVECQRLERNGIVSSRQWENQQWADVIDEVVATASVNDWEVEQPLQFDFRLGNMCNLQCQMCNKEASHLVSVERARMVKSGLGANHPDWYDNIADKKQALLQPGIDWTSFKDMLKKARKIKIIGGEPTVAPDMFRLLDTAVYSGDASHIELSFYTNITNMQDRWLEQLGKFERVIVNCSLEGMGEMNDYLRPPSKWDSVWKNFDKLVKYSNTKAGKNIKVRVTTVNQITNALHIVPFWRMMHQYQMQHDRGIAMSTNQLIEPNYYSMQYAPQWLRDEQRKQIEEFLNEIGNSPHFTDYQEPLLEVIAFANDPDHTYNPAIMQQYVDITQRYDQFRGHSINRVSPEFGRIQQELLGTLDNTQV